MNESFPQTRRQWREWVERLQRHGSARALDLGARMNEALTNAGPYPGDEDIEDHDVVLRIDLGADDLRLLNHLTDRKALLETNDPFAIDELNRPLPLKAESAMLRGTHQDWVDLVARAQLGPHVHQIIEHFVPEDADAAEVFIVDFDGEAIQRRVCDEAAALGLASITVTDNIPTD